ncbi:Nucleotide-binding alpha-beta plait [Penicillium capsulatum]|uniref:Nucleotide-binding alpha-beta plait n=1 Tax=Penicillium capsulatum TaxID=69766 RepID=A0A9W9LVX7_9EURO|nr:Nucleotide-binding alpha-beta plait [Penicillium capsulatum]
MYHVPVQPITVDQHDQEMQMHLIRPLGDVLNESKLPIGNKATQRTPQRFGVVKIENIPYTVTRQEVSQFFGRNARMVQGWSVHIIMERSTGKTEDCYVEFNTQTDAEEAVKRANRNLDIGRGPRMGMRHIAVKISSQDELMHAMFPLAKCVKWIDGRPVETGKPPGDELSPGFTGFVTKEEMFCAVRHAENPQRSIFAMKVPQRTYEFLVSTMWKYPWYATNMYTVQERNKIFQALRFMLEALVARIANENVVGLDRRLVSELVRVGLQCPAFNPRMKFCLAHIGNELQVLQRMSEVWLTYFPFDTLTWLPPQDPVALEFCALLLSKAYVPDHSNKGLMQRWNNENFLEPYGRIWLEWEDSMVPKVYTFADCVNFEKTILRSMLSSGFHNRRMEIVGVKYPKATKDTGSVSGSSTPTVRSLGGDLTRPSSAMSVVWNPSNAHGQMTPVSETRQVAQPSGVLNRSFEFPARRHVSIGTVPFANGPFSPAFNTQHWPSRSDSQAPGLTWGQGPFRSLPGRWSGNYGYESSQHQRLSSNWDFPQEEQDF